MICMAEATAGSNTGAVVEHLDRITANSVRTPATEVVAGLLAQIRHEARVNSRKETNMRKIFLIVLLFATLIGAGFASAHFRKVQPSFKPHTIVYRVTHYDEAGSLVRTDTLVRQVFSDGSWKHTDVQPNGTVIYSKGQLTGPFTAETTDSNSPELVGYKYVEPPGHDSRAWISPDLQDFLMFTALRKDRSKVSVMEAVNITTP